MKKQIVVILVLLSILISCEPQDICDQQASPRLVVKFFKKDTDKELKLESIKVWENTVSDENIVIDTLKVDSIFIPMPKLLSDTNTSLIIQANGDLFDNVKLNYQADVNFVSKACGMKLNYNQVELSKESTLNHIKKINQTSKSISNEAKAHLYFYY